MYVEVYTSYGTHQHHRTHEKKCKRRRRPQDRAPRMRPLGDLGVLPVLTHLIHLKIDRIYTLIAVYISGRRGDTDTLNNTQRKRTRARARLHKRTRARSLCANVLCAAVVLRRRCCRPVPVRPVPLSQRQISVACLAACVSVCAWCVRIGILYCLCSLRICFRVEMCSPQRRHYDRK